MPLTEDDWDQIIDLMRKAKMPPLHASKKIAPAGPWGDCLKSILPLLGNACILGLIGDRGTGKTQLAVELIRRTCIRKTTARYARIAELYMDVRATYGDNDERLTEREVIDSYCRPRLLVLDEAHERDDTKTWMSSLLNLLVDRRYAEMKDTILIANLGVTEFIQSVGPTIASRMKEKGGVIECKWPGFR